MHFVIFSTLLLSAIFGLAHSANPSNIPFTNDFCEVVSQADSDCGNRDQSQTGIDLYKDMIGKGSSLTWSEIKESLYAMVQGMPCDEVKPLNEQCKAAQLCVSEAYSS